ncbi:MAG: hypothetical protein A3E87_10410 [Gammaproteobacteria bacterium RIFCSPHIGHO2_12_FULL_35_23]|nr:MAG: hypothetical protein A3E87_10410 [Gammaproteobacteria bacterium RIFCSPHIGHO2_12_FULL_35_23]
MLLKKSTQAFLNFLLEELPKPFNQVQIWEIGRKENKLDVFAVQPLFNFFRIVVACIIQYKEIIEI